MLLGKGQRPANSLNNIDTVHNYYEQLVVEQILQLSNRSRTDTDFLADTACVALNRLPPKYIRHTVDMTFFMSTQELEENYDRVAKAVTDALAYVTEREAERPETQTTDGSA